jgi:branched-chain amino acid transport system permease protein
MVVPAGLGAVALALLPLFVSGYVISLFIVLYANIALATAWAFFSGTTRYISLATAAFFGVGIYALAILHVHVPTAAALLGAAIIGFLVAVVVGLSTLRLRGVYFVVFTFGLTELVHQVLNWWEIKINRTVTRYIFTDVSNVAIYQVLLALALLTIVGSWYVSRLRLGYALRAIGEDETVARHTGIDTTTVKVLCFAGSASIMALVGAVLALRYPYIDASIAFNNTWSFQVLIAALLGGPSRPWGPALGAVPLVLLSEYLSGTFPHHFPIALGLCFVVIVYFLPGGVAPLLERALRSWSGGGGRHPWLPDLDQPAAGAGFKARLQRLGASLRT